MHWEKRKLLEVSGKYWESCVIHAGVKLDVFSAMGDDAVLGDVVADKLQSSNRGMVQLLNALTAMGLLEKSNGKYSNTDFSRQYLCRDSSDYTGYILMHHHHLMYAWTDLADSVVSGKPRRTSASNTDDETERESFLMGMFNIASATAPLYADRIDLSGHHHLLDMGGGPGTFAIHFCLKYPRLQATVFDLPTTRQFAEKTIAAFGLTDRIAFTQGSYRDASTGLEQVYDAVWMSHILHGHGQESAQDIVRKAAAATTPGGTLYIHEFVLNNAKDGPVFPALFSLNMLTGTDNGMAYSEAELMAMLENAGAHSIHRLNQELPNGAGIIVGKVT